MVFLALFMSSCKKNPEIGEESCPYVVCSYTIGGVNISFISLFFELNPTCDEAYVVTPRGHYYGNYLFYNIITLSIPSHLYYKGRDYTVTRIEHETFSGLELDTLIIPNTVVSIDSDAFGSCRIANLICMAATPPVIESSYYESFDCSFQSIYVPNESVDKYKCAHGWFRYADIIVGY